MPILALRMVFVLLLIILFIWRFAAPSVQKYLDAGVVTEKTWRLRTLEDFPAITFCILNSETQWGWKKMIPQVEDEYVAWIDLFCSNATDVEEAVGCLDHGTYSINDTIAGENEVKHNGFDFMRSGQKHYDKNEFK